MAGAHALNEVLNGDHGNLMQLLEGKAEMNILGCRGDGPIHIAVYRRDARMLGMLLDAKADVRFRNMAGNTAMHLAAFLGSADMVRLLYSVSTAEERFQLWLEMRNNKGETPLDLCSRPVEDWDLDSYRLYAEADVAVNTLDSFREPMERGRRECAAFLRQQVDQDRLNKVQGSIQLLIDCNTDRTRTNAILRGGTAGTDAERVYSAALDYPKALDDLAWRRGDIDFFLGYERSVREVVLGTHSQDLVQRTLATALDGANLAARIKHLNSQGRDLEEQRWRAPPESLGLQWT